MLVKSFKSIFIFAFIFFSFSLYARSLQETFLEGNKFYYEQKYTLALQRYELIEPKGPAISYNIGNAYYRLGDKAQALAAWMRAQKNASRRIIDRARHNIIATQTELGIHDNSASTYMGYRLSLISFLLLQLLFLAGWYLFFILFFCTIPYRALFLTLVMICNTIIISAIGFKYWSDSHQRAIVIVDNLSMRAGPDNHFHAMDLIPYAQTVKIKSKVGGWYKIKYTGTLGWVSGDSVDII